MSINSKNLTALAALKTQLLLAFVLELQQVKLVSKETFWQLGWQLRLLDIL